MTAKLLFVHALSPLHPGTGQGAGVIDLPVAREVATGIPYLPGSSLKGVLRDRCTGADCKYLFGPDLGGSDVNSQAGAAIFTDQRLLCLPVRSLAGTFAWVTSPFVLQRFRRDCLSLGLKPPEKGIPTGPAELTKARLAAVPLKIGDKVYLEDLDLEAIITDTAQAWTVWLKTRLFPPPKQPDDHQRDDKQTDEWQLTFANHFCIVHDDVFSFLLATATEVLARNQLTDLKTSNNLWYEEALPAESILYGMVYAQQIGGNGKSPADVLTAVQKLTTGVMQLGGNATIGRGLCRLVMEA